MTLGPSADATTGPPRRVLLVVNPVASGVTPRGRVLVQNSIATRHHLEVAETHRRGHATRLASGAAARGIDTVFALGGDGTLNEVVNGLVGTDVAVGALPGGSTNVFARILGFPNEPTEAVETMLDSLDAGRTRRIGLGNVNGRSFCFHVGMGFDAAVVARVEQRGALKRWLGHPLFAYSGFVTFLREFDRTTPPLRVEFPAVVARTPIAAPSARSAGSDASAAETVASDAASDGPASDPSDAEGTGRRERSRADGFRISAEHAVQRARDRISGRRPTVVASSEPGARGVDGFFAIALNADPYTYFGARPVSLAPRATLDTPLSFVVLRTLGMSETLRTLGASLLGGDRVARRRHVTIEHDVRRAVVRGYRPFPWQVDGDHLGDTELLEFGWEPDAIRVIVP